MRLIQSLGDSLQRRQRPHIVEKVGWQLELKPRHNERKSSSKAIEHEIYDHRGPFFPVRELQDVDLYLVQRCNKCCSLYRILQRFFVEKLQLFE